MALEASEQFTRYQLRRTLAPWKFRETIDEVLAFAKEHKIEEVIWKIDTEDISHGLPTLERIKTYLPALTESRQRLGDAGIAMSINPWVTQGMRDAGWDLRSTFPDFEWLTDITGIQAKSQACPLGPAWRQWIADAYDMYASIGPRILWLEDDFRVHRHRPVTVACFCQRHIQDFSKKMGRPFTRESLAAEILKPGEPSPVRTRWFEFVGGVMCEVVELLAARIYPKYPNVQLGLMGNALETSALERRDWDRLMKALAGPHKRVTFRPCMGMYSENNLRDFYQSRHMVASTLKAIRRPVQACSEVENYTYTQFSKSLRATRTQLLLSTALGCPSMTLNLYDHLGTPLADDPGFGRLLSGARPMIEQVAAAFGTEGVERGVRMLTPENGSDHVHLKPGAKFWDMLVPQEPWGEILQSMGTSITWSDSPVVAISGQRLRAYRSSIDVLFAGGVLLDVAALDTLREMVGPAKTRELTGVTLNTIFERRDRLTSIEMMIDPEFGGPTSPKDTANAGGKVPAKHASTDTGGLLVRIGDMTPDPNARVISRFANADLEFLLPGFTLFENSLGGRVAICPYELHASSEPERWFHNWHRMHQLQLVTNWLFHDRTPLQVQGGAYGLPIRTDYPDHTSLAIFNLSLDPWPHVKATLALDHAPRHVQRLKPDGQWDSLSSHHWDDAAKKLIIHSNVPLEYGDVAVFRIQ